MNMQAVPEFGPAVPEIFLAAAAMVLLMLGVFRGNKSTRIVCWLSALAAAVALVLVASGPDKTMETFGGLFVSDPFSVYMKCFVLIGSIATLLLSISYIRMQQFERFEYPVLVLLSTVGMLMMVSANDLMSLYLGLELQSLPLYVLAAFKRDSTRATEAGLKYFVLGALSSGMLLYGCSMIYGFSGATNFTEIAKALTGHEGLGVGVIVGIVFVAAGLAFKVSAVPFHMWTPDVYEGAPTSVTAFFATAPKIAAMALFVRVMVEPFAGMTDEWRQIIVFISVASMLLGAFAAIGQTNIKRLMAYSSIGHMGYALVGLAAGSEEGVRGVLIYMAIYLAMNIGAFACILCMRRKDGMVEQISDLAGLSKSNPAIALALAIFMFSLAGIPPLAGFFGKFYVFMAAIHAGLYALAVIGVLASVVGAFYYVRIIKIMYFDEPAAHFERPLGGEVTVLMAAAALFTLFFFVYPGPLVAWARTAAAALIG
jgi:NADH-quinone oxidoreductase subunit N